MTTRSLAPRSSGIGLSLALAVGMLAGCAVDTDRDSLEDGRQSAGEDGYTIVEGDIVLGPEEMVAARSETNDDGKTFGLVVNDPNKLWPGRRVPYVIENGFEPAAVTKIKAAMDEWTKKVKFTFVARTTEKDFISFHADPKNACNSRIGRVAGGQIINLPKAPSTCPAHEIGHAIGLFHEQSRGDRDKYIKINIKNVKPGFEGNFAAQVRGAEYVQPYDFASIMHYGPFFFAADPKVPTITKLNGSTTGFGQREALSKSDVESVDIVYTKYRPAPKPASPAPSAPTPAGSAENRGLVSKYYVDVLGRAASAAEIDHWVSQIDAGTTRLGVARAIVDSPESRERFVTAVYGSVLGRAPEAAGLRNWAKMIAGGTDRETVVARIAASGEAYGRAGSANGPWVASLYRSILGREPDQGGLDAWTKQANGGMSREAIASGFTKSDEGVNKLVAGFYVTYLGRQPDAEGLATYVQAYRAGHRSEQIQAWILASEEYFVRKP